jgi:hypothetical protein
MNASAIGVQRSCHLWHSVSHFRYYIRTELHMLVRAMFAATVALTEPSSPTNFSFARRDTRVWHAQFDSAVWVVFGADPGVFYPCYLMGGLLNAHRRCVYCLSIFIRHVFSASNMALHAAGPSYSPLPCFC